MNYEPRDASLSVIGISAGLLVIMVAASIVASAWLYHSRYRGAGVIPGAPRTSSFTHGSDERIGILEDYASVTRAADEHLRRYGWVDRNSGVAHIPIERAMDLMASGVKPAPSSKEPGQVP